MSNRLGSFKRALLVCLFGLLGLLFGPRAEAQLANSLWPIFQGNYGSSGQGITEGASPTVKWTFEPNGGLMDFNSCVVGPDGTVYLDDELGNLYAIDPATGTQKWEYSSNYRETSSAPVLSSNGTIFLSQLQGIVAVDSTTGQLVWQVAAPPTATFGACALGPTGTVYVIGEGGLYALNPANGAQLWVVPLSEDFEVNYVPPTIGPDGTVYVGPDYLLTAVNGTTGAVKWTFTDIGQTYNEENLPLLTTVGPDGTVYASDWEGNVFALDGQTGTLKWETLLTGGFTNVAVGANGMVYSVVAGGVYAINSANGIVLWSNNVIGGPAGEVGVLDPPVIESDGSVDVISASNALYSLNGNTGAVNWSFQLAAPANDAVGPLQPQGFGSQTEICPLAIGPDGGIYVPTENFGLIALASAGLSLSFTPNPVQETTATTGIITLNSPAPSGGTGVALSSDDPQLQLPATVAIPAGATQATFKAKSLGVSSTVTAHVKAQLPDMPPFYCALTIVPWLRSIVLSPPSVLGGSDSTGTVFMNAAASGETVVQLSSSSPSAQFPVYSFVIPAGWTSGTFKITTSAVTTPTTATIAALVGSDRITAPLSIVGLKGVSLSPSSIAGGNRATGTVTLTGAAPPTGAVIDLTSSSGSAIVPAAFTVKAGSSTGTFTVKTTAVASSTVATITARLGNAYESAKLTIVPPSLSSIATDANAVVNGNKLGGILRLSGPALSQTTIPLQVSNSKFASVTSATVPAGSAVGTFTITTTSTPGGATISGTYGGVSRTSNVFQVVGVKSVTYNPNSAPGGDPSEGLVTLTAGLPMNVSCSLTSSSPLVIVPANVSIGTGGFVLTTRPVATNTVVKVTAKLAGSSVSGSFTVLAPKITSFTISPASVQGSSSTAVTGTIQLSGPPPGGFSVKVTSSDPAAASVASPVTFNGATGTFTVAHSKVSVGVTLTLSVVLNGVTSSASLAVTP